MKYAKILLGLVLIISPISLHIKENLIWDLDFMMTPIGSHTVDHGDYFFTPHSFKWYSEEGITDYILDYEDVGEVGAGHWFFKNPITGDGLSIEGLLTIILLYALAIYVFLSFFKNKQISITADILMIGCSILGLIAFILFIDNSWVNFDVNVPISPILALVLGIIGLIFSIKSKK